MNSDIYIESEKMRGSSLFTTAVPYSSNPDKSNDFLTLLEKMQSQRLDEQRCEMPDIHIAQTAQAFPCWNVELELQPANDDILLKLWDSEEPLKLSRG
ncbi:unnamed protein product [Heligmosomoides polygyrus]|uniref:Uncharacterized protein n=1 Tax=Heligmosomoides polygyrus TaxID=6339 RepID=A0A183GIS2_HELPZ|nr:unnamed protein product [Heligmosomoides polygyrus]